MTETSLHLWSVRAADLGIFTGLSGGQAHHNTDATLPPEMCFDYVRDVIFAGNGQTEEMSKRWASDRPHWGEQKALSGSSLPFL